MLQGCEIICITFLQKVCCFFGGHLSGFCGVGGFQHALLNIFLLCGFPFCWLRALSLGVCDVVFLDLECGVC